MEYEQLLKKAFEKLPKKLETKSRFVIPEIVAEISGQKTIVKNFGDIVSKLRRDPIHVSKYLSRETAAARSIQGNMLIFQGKLSKEILQRKLVDYVKEFVYCKTCGEPDTRLFKKDRVTMTECEACGAKHPIKSI
jgi:translation initiation factor 2 subunit 2